MSEEKQIKRDVVEVLQELKEVCQDSITIIGSIVEADYSQETNKLAFDTLTSVTNTILSLNAEIRGHLKEYAKT